jgi:hypothetical protein
VTHSTSNIDNTDLLVQVAATIPDERSEAARPARSMMGVDGMLRGVREE